jgi:hypothetical protein
VLELVLVQLRLPVAKNVFDRDGVDEGDRIPYVENGHVVKDKVPLLSRIEYGVQPIMPNTSDRKVPFFTILCSCLLFLEFLESSFGNGEIRFEWSVCTCHC